MLVVTVAATIGAAAGDTERITKLWVSAAIARDGSAQITESIDWDFGSQSKHGIFRDVPGLSPEAPVKVSSPDAPADVDVSDFGAKTRIRIGDPNRTISNRHRYLIEYPLDRGVLLDVRDFAWNAVGTEWPVSIDNVDIHLTSVNVLTDVRCSQGVFDSTQSCSVSGEGGSWVIHVDHLNRSEGVTVYASLGFTAAPQVVAPSPPAGRASDPGTGIAKPAGLAFLAALAAGLLVTPFVRRAGREQIAAGGAADVAYATNSATDVTLIDAGKLADLANVEFVPPDVLEPAQGGVLISESVRNEHKTAWLLEAAVQGAIDIQQDGKTFTITRGPKQSTQFALPLTTAFAGRDRVQLGKYDPSFGAAWASIGNDLTRWKKSSELWDDKSERRVVKGVLFGVLAMVVGTAGAVAAAVFANRSGGTYLPFVAVGAAFAGAGAALVASAWELRVRTPLGSALYLRTESFRRFLHDSEAQHVQQAASMGMLREYTAWAVAMGEGDRWSKAVAAAGIPPQQADTNFVYFAPALMTAASRTSVKPSSSGGGGGGGRVGGGGGGGGGGSW